MTNINVHWNEQVSDDSLEERRSLALGSGDLPDIFYFSEMPTTDIFRYGKQGTFLKLNDLIDTYAPNLKQLMEENPEIEKAITFPDGNIYSLPSLISKDFLSFNISFRPWISRNTLDEVGMDIPETTDEFYDFLKATKEKTGKTPYGGTAINVLFEWLLGSFGVANNGIQNSNIDADPDNPNKVRFYATTDNYKELLEYVHKLYSEELIEKNIFSIQWDQYLANAIDGNYASTMFFSPKDLFGEEIGSDFEAIGALKGPHGDKAFTKVIPMVYKNNGFIVTDKNPNPAAAVRWLDYFYSDEGAKLFFMGIEDETYEENADGELVYKDNIMNSPNGLTMEQEIAKYLPWVGSFHAIIKEDYFAGSDVSEQSLEATEKIAPYIPEENWPSFLYTEEENEFLISKGSDISKYVEEMRDKFISGSVPLSEWDNYVKEIEGMGLEEYMEIQQDAFDRYNEE